MKASIAVGFCTGLDSGSSLHFTKLANGTDCQRYARTKELSFSLALPPCEDLATTEICKSQCDAARAAGQAVQLTTKNGEQASAAEACKVTCDLCASGSTLDLPKPSGCVLEHGSNASDPSTGTLRYYTAEERKRYLGINYTPICEAFVCNIPLQEVEIEATMDSVPTCAYGSEFIGAKQEEEGNTYRYFYYITVGSISFIVCLAYSCSKHCCCRAGCNDWKWPKWPTHKLIWIGLVARLSDLATDWAFLLINIRGDLFENRVNPEVTDRVGHGSIFDPTVEFDLDTFKVVALFVCIVGSILTPIDILSKAPACQSRSEGAGISLGCSRLGRKSAVVIGFLVILAEDLPQILISSVFIKQMNTKFFDGNPTNIALTLGNISISVGSLLYNLYLVVSGCCNWKSDKEAVAAQEHKLQKLQMRMADNVFNAAFENH
jgi:hypothetical protein